MDKESEVLACRLGVRVLRRGCGGRFGFEFRDVGQCRMFGFGDVGQSRMFGFGDVGQSKMLGFCMEDKYY